MITSVGCNYLFNSTLALPPWQSHTAPCHHEMHYEMVALYDMTQISFH